MIPYKLLSSSLLSFDLVTRKYTSSNFNLKQLGPKATLNGNLPSNEMTNRLGQTFYTMNQNMLKFIISKDGDTTTNPLATKNWLPQTASRLAHINNFKVVITIPGDILIKVGNIVGLVVPKMQPQQGATENNQMRSGNYLVSSVHHKFVMDISSTILELLSDSTSVPLPIAVTTSPSMQKILAS